MKYNKLFYYVDKILLIISAAILAFIAGLTLVQVFYRYVLNDALSWSAELTRIGFIWMTFIGSAVAINQKRHLKIDAIINFLSAINKIRVEIVSHTLILLFMSYITIGSMQLSIKTINTLTASLRWPRSVFYFPLALGALFIVFFAIRVIWEDVDNIKKLKEKVGY